MCGSSTSPREHAWGFWGFKREGWRGYYDLLVLWWNLLCRAVSIIQHPSLWYQERAFENVEIRIPFSFFSQSLCFCWLESANSYLPKIWLMNKIYLKCKSLMQITRDDLVSFIRTINNFFSKSNFFPLIKMQLLPDQNFLSESFYFTEYLQFPQKNGINCFIWLGVFWITDSLVGIWGNLWRSSGPTPLPTQAHLQQHAQDHVQVGLCPEGASKASPGSSSSAQSPSQCRGFSSCSDGTPCASVALLPLVLSRWRWFGHPPLLSGLAVEMTPRL